MKRNRIVIDFDNKEIARAQPRRKSGGGIGRPLLIIAVILILIVGGTGAGDGFVGSDIARDYSGHILEAREAIENGRGRHLEYSSPCIFRENNWHDRMRTYRRLLCALAAPMLWPGTHIAFLPHPQLTIHA